MATLNEEHAAVVAAAMVSGTVGDVLAGLDPAAVAAGRLAGRVETLLWAQGELQVELDQLKATDRFADTRALEDFLVRVRDSLRNVQDGSGEWAGLVRSLMAVPETVAGAEETPPGTEMGG